MLLGFDLYSIEIEQQERNARTVPAQIAAAGIALAAGVNNTKTQGGKIAKALGSVAAGISALKGHQGTLYALSANAEAAAARVTDTDFARSSANLAKFSILNQSAMAMVSQANQAQAAVLAVLQ